MNIIVEKIAFFMLKIQLRIIELNEILSNIQQENSDFAY